MLIKTALWLRDVVWADWVDKVISRSRALTLTSVTLTLVLQSPRAFLSRDERGISKTMLFPFLVSEERNLKIAVVFAM